MSFRRNFEFRLITIFFAGTSFFTKGISGVSAPSGAVVSDCRNHEGSQFLPLAPLDGLFAKPCTGTAGQQGGCMTASQCKSAYSSTPVKSTSCSTDTICCEVKTCVSKFGNLHGYCLPMSTCTGGTLFDLCSGSGRCCVAETTSIACPANPELSFDTFRQIYPALSERRAEATWPYFNMALQDINATNCSVVSAFASEVYEETAGLLKTEESNNKNYDKGKWRGRGALQLTNEINYKDFSKFIGEKDVVTQPDRIALLYLGFKSASWFWNTQCSSKKCGLTQFADGTLVNFYELSWRLNGGNNGLSERIAQYKRALEITNCTTIVLGTGGPCDKGDKGECTIDKYCTTKGTVVKHGLCKTYKSKSIICCSKK